MSLKTANEMRQEEQHLPALSQNQKPTKTSLQAPRVQNWDVFKEEIRHLYITKRLTVRGLVDAMKERHAFTAK
jgi:hypothetical protein